MDFFELVKRRRSVRLFVDRPIRKHDLECLVDAARFAPTARAVEPWEFVVVTDKTALKALASATDHGTFIKEAAACIAVFCKDTKYYLEDGSSAVENILLAATELGIGSCWVAGDKKPYVTVITELLLVPSGYKLVALIALGYPHDMTVFKEVPRRPLTDVLHWERF